MSWFKSDPAKVAAREAAKAEKAAYNAKFNADVKGIHMTNELIAFLNNPDFLDGIGRYETIKAMNMIDALDATASFGSILDKSVKLNNLKLVKKILAKTQELDVDIAPREVNTAIRQEKMMGRTDDKSKKISEEIMQTLQSYLDGESINAPATTPMNTVVQNKNAKYNADVEGIHMTNELIAFLNSPDFLDGIGPRQSIKVKSMINALGPTANFGSILDKVVKLNNLELVNVIISKVEELKVDIAPRNVNMAIRKRREKMMGSTDDKSKKISEQIIQTLQRYLDGEIINASAAAAQSVAAPAASMKPAAAPAAPTTSMKQANASMKQANASMKPANAPNAPLNQGKLEDGLQRLEMDLKEEGTSLNFIVDKEATPSLYRYGKMVLGQAPATSMQAAPTPAPMQAAPTKLTFAQRKALKHGAPAASMPQATMATGGMRSRKRRNSKTKKGRTSKSKTPRKAKK